MRLGSLSIALTGTAFWFHLSTVISDSLSDESVVPLNVTANATSCGASAPPPEIMASVYTVLAFSSVIARIVSGYVIDRIAPRFVLAARARRRSARLMPRVGRRNPRRLHDPGRRRPSSPRLATSSIAATSSGAPTSAAYRASARRSSCSAAPWAVPLGLCRPRAGPLTRPSTRVSLFFMVVALRHGVARRSHRLRSRSCERRRTPVRILTS